nr:MAG TPA: minor tail protein [Caudoviricetes sp.]
MSLADSIGLITAANEPLQDPKKVGNGLKSIAINFAGLSASAKNGSLVLNKTAKALKGIAGIDVYKDKTKGQLKSMVQLLDELHPKWGQLTDDQRAGLSEAIAGKHRANVFQALMSNYEQFKKIRSEFANGDDFNSAEIENAKYVDSIAGKINKLKETMTSIGTTLVNTDMTKGFLNGLISIGEGIEKVITWADKANISLPLLLASVSGIRGLFKGLGTPIKEYDELLYGSKSSSGKKVKDSFWGRMSDYANRGAKPIEDSSPTPTKARRKAADSKKIDFSNTSIIDMASKKQEGLNEKLKTGVKLNNKHAESTEGNTKTRRKGLRAMEESIVAFKTTGQELDTSKSKIKTAGAAFKELGKSFAGAISGALLGTAVMGVASIAISKGIELGAKAWDNYAHGIENAKNKTIEHRDSLIAEGKVIQQNSAFVKENAKDIDTIARKQREYAKLDQSKMSAEQLADMQKVNQMAQKLAEIFPTLVSGYDKNGNPLLSLSTDADSLIKKLESAENKKKRLIEADNRTIFSKNSDLMRKGERAGNTGGVLKQIADASKGFEYKGLLDGVSGQKIRYASRAEQAFREASRHTDNLVEIRKNYKKNYDALENTVNNSLQKWNSYTQKYDKANGQNTEFAQKLIPDKRAFKSLTDNGKEAVAELSSLMQWGKSTNIDRDISQLISLGSKASPEKIKAYGKELQKLNDIYRTDKDYKAYSQGVDKLAEKLARAGGGAAKSWADKLKDVQRGYSSFEEQQETEYMKRHGAKPSDFEFGTDAQAAFADKTLQTFRALKEAMDGIMNAGSRDDVLANWEQMAKNDSLPSYLRNIGKELSKTGNASQSAQKGVSKVLNAIENANTSNAGERNKLSQFFKDLSKWDGKSDLKLNNGDILKANELLSMYNNNIKQARESGKVGLKGILDESRLQAHLNSVDEFYKNQKIEIPIDVKLKLAEEGLTDNQLKEIEAQVKEWGLKDAEANKFRENMAPFAKTNKSKEEKLRAYSNSDKAVKDVIEGGFTNQIDQMSKYNSQIKSMADNYAKLTGKGKEFANTLNEKDWTSWMKQFGSLNSGLQGLVNKYGMDTSGMKAMQDTYSMAKGLGYSDEKITKTIDFIINKEGIEAFTQIQALLNSIPDKKTKSLLFQLLGGEKGHEVLQQMLMIDQAIPDQKTKSIIVSLISNTDAFQKGEIQTAEQLWNAIPDNVKKTLTFDANTGQITSAIDNATKGKKVTVPVDANTNNANKKINDTGKNKKATVKVEADTSPADERIKNLTNTSLMVNLNNSTPTKPPTFSTFAPSSPNIATGGATNFKFNMPKLPDISGMLKGKIKEFNVPINFKAPIGGVLAATAGIKNAVRGVKGKNVDLKANDNASGTAGKVKGAVSSIPSKRSVTLKAVDEASGVISKAIHALMSFGGARTASVKAEFISVFKTVKETVGGMIDKAKDALFGKGSKQPPKKQNPRGGLVAYSLPTAKTTQLNPLVGKPIFSAGVTSVNGNPLATPQSGSGGSLRRQPVTDDYTAQVESFNLKVLNGYLYKQITYVDRLKFSLKDVANGFKESVDILAEFERALTRIEQATKKIDLKLQRARGSQRLSLLDLQRHQFREYKRRLNNELPTVIQKRDWERSELRKQGVQFAKDGTLTANGFAMRLKWKKEEAEIDKKLEKAKDKEKKKLEEKKKLLADNVRLLEAYEQSVDKIADIDYKMEEMDIKIESNIDEKQKVVIEAWHENFDAVTKIMENSIQRLSNSLAVLDIKFKYAFGSDRLSILDAQIGKYEQMQSQLQSNISALNNLKDNLKTQLSGYGFQFSGDDISNYQEVINKLNNTSSLYSEIKGLAEKYFDITENRLPSITKDWEDYNSKIKDTNKTKLEDAKTIEDKIMSMLKKSTEDRIKLIEKEVDARKELIEKRKEEFNAARKEAEYQDDIAEKMKDLETLRKKLEIYSRDTSQKGQKEYQKLQDEYDKKQKDLRKAVENHSAEAVLKSFDDDSKRLDNQLKQEKEKQDNPNEENELRQKALQAISTGVVDINGTMVDLKKALIDYMNQYEGGLGSMGAYDKAEMLAKLEDARRVPNNYSHILDRIGIQGDLNTGFIQYDKFREIANKNSNKIVTQNIGSLVTINGNITESFESKVLKIVQEEMKKNNKNIIGNMG